MIFSCPHSSKMDSRVVFDSAHNSAKGESHTDLAGIRIMMKVILQNGLAFPQKYLMFIQEFRLSLNICILLFFISLPASLNSNSKIRVPIFIISSENYLGITYTTLF